MGGRKDKALRNHPRSCSVQDAKNRFSEVVEAARRRPQTVTKHGKPAVVVADATEYERLRHLERSEALSFADLLLAMPRDDGEFPRLEGAHRAISTDVSNRHGRIIGVAQVAARRRARGLVRTAANGRSFRQRHQDRRDRPRDRSAARDKPELCRVRSRLGSTRCLALSASASLRSICKGRDGRGY